MEPDDGFSLLNAVADFLVPWYALLAIPIRYKEKI